jgi:hypothetical protein
VPEICQFSLIEFTEMSLIVSSRLYDLKINGQLTTCFIPYVDLLKAGEVDESSWKYDDQKKGFVLTSSTEIKRG